MVAINSNRREIDDGGDAPRRGDCVSQKAKGRIAVLVGRDGDQERVGFLDGAEQLALAWPDGECAIYEGRVDGTLTWPPRGTLGFGYDPVFVPSGHEQTFAEIAPEQKHAISHRADAFARLVADQFA